MASKALLAIAGLEGNPYGDIYSLDDEMVKLVAYTIVSVKRDEECVMDGGDGTVIVAERMTGETFALSTIAQFLQQRVPDPKHNGQQVRRSELEDIREHLKYLRLYFVVSTRWPREPMKFEEREVEALREIKEKIG